MKLLIYSHFFAPSVGGVENIVQSLAAGVANLRDMNGGHEFKVTLVTEIPAGGYDDKQFPFEIIRQPAFFELWRRIRAADAVHIAGPSLLPMLLARISGKPYIVEHHGYQAICPNGLLVHQLDRAICPGHFQAARYGECFKCLHVEFASRGIAAQLLLLMFPRYRLARGAASNIAITGHVQRRHNLPRSQVVYYGIEDPLSNVVAEQLISETNVCVACVGRLVPEKGLPILLEAVKLLRAEGRRMELRIIGDGPERSRLEKIIQDENLQHSVSISGFLTGEALTAALHNVNVVVMPSTWEEAAGLSAIEQMMRGRLVIAADIGGLSEVAGDAAIKFTPGDAASLADALRSVLEDATLIATLGQQARQRALEKFARNRMVDDHARIYRTCRKPAG
jgi:glycogen(starch) synthase